MKRLEKAYFEYIKSDVYLNYFRNKMIFEGKSAQVFYYDVLRRVKLEYMGLVNENGCYREFTRYGNKLIPYERKFANLIVPHSILSSITRVYTEFGSNSEPIFSCEEDVKELFKNLDLQEKLEEILLSQSIHGACLLRGGVEGEEPTIEVFDVNQYFKIGKDYVLFNHYSDDVLAFEIHQKDKTIYKMAKSVAGSLNEIEYLEPLEEFGAIKVGLSYEIKHSGYQVAEIKNIFNRSDYTDDLIKINRELVIGETLTSQAFDKVANPLLQIPDGAVEYDEDGNLTVKLQDRILIVEENDKEVKQIQMATKTTEWDIHRKNLIEQIYQQTGTNEQVFGLNLNGSSASGEAKRRDLERTISTVVSKRDKALAGLEKVMKWIYKRIVGKDTELVLTGKDILNLSFLEKIEIVTRGITQGVMSLETAVKFLNIANTSYDEELEAIKKSPATIKLLAENISILNNLSTDNRINDYVARLTDELVGELEL